LISFFCYRGTSPQPDIEREKRSRIARTTEAFELSFRRSRPPRMITIAIQTASTSEYGPLTIIHRKVMPSSNFDYYDMVKKNIELKPLNPPDTDTETEDQEDQEHCVIEKAAMTQLLPDHKPILRPIVLNKSNSSAVAEESEESEYEYESEEEDVEAAIDENDESSSHQIGKISSNYTTVCTARK
jgi:hypothetical protein